jgi:hypothetical protein
LWLLDAPGRIWPWFPVAFAALGAIALAALVYEDPGAAFVQALMSLLLAGGGFYYAGDRFLALDYSALRWLCWGVSGGLALNAVAALLVAVFAGRK